MSRAVAFDCNIYRGVGNERFNALLSGEQVRGVLPYADPWTMAELLAHVSDARDPDFAPCSSAIARLSRRCLRAPTDGRHHGVLADAEVQVAHFVTGLEIAANKTSTVELVDLCQAVEEVGAGSLPPAAVESLSRLAREVSEAEQWFVDHIRNIQNALDEVARSLKSPSADSDKREAIEQFFNSEEAVRLDSIALIRRAYSQVDLRLPDEIPEELVNRVGEAFRGGIKAAALAFKRVLSNNVNLDKPKTRNLLWDQNIAFNIGHQVDGHPILIVTGDRYFGAAAAESGFPDAVYDLDKYADWLGVTA